MTPVATIWAALPAALLLAACAAEKTPEPAPQPTPTRAVPRTLIPANFDPARLGAHVEGMDVEDETVGGRKAPLATVGAYVACGKGTSVCDPANLPPGTVYTYVLTITPAEAAATVRPSETPEGGGAEGDLVQPVAPEELIRTLRPVPEFNGALGFSRAEATAALGAEDALTVTLDQNRLIWRVSSGSGWQAGKPITLWWQSTRAPARPAPAYRVELGGKGADIAAPFPADKPVEGASQR